MPIVAHRERPFNPETTPFAKNINADKDCRVIERHEVMPLLLEACPSFRARWEEYLSRPSYEAGLLFIDLGEFAQHLVELMKTGATAELPAAFSAVERLEVDGDSYVQNAVTVGLLEGIQNVPVTRRSIPLVSFPI